MSNISYAAHFSFNGDLGNNPYVITSKPRSDVISASFVPVEFVSAGNVAIGGNSIIHVFNAARSFRQVEIRLDAEPKFQPNGLEARLSLVIEKLRRFGGSDIPIVVSIGVQKLSNGKTVEAFTLRDNAAQVEFTMNRVENAGNTKRDTVIMAVGLRLSSPKIQPGIAQGSFH